MQSYLDLLRDVLENGESHDDRTGVGTRSVFGRQWRHDMRQGFPLLTTKKVPLRWVAEELFWFLSGSTDEADLRARGVDIWKEWATEEQCARFGREAGDLGHVYGGLWRDFLCLENGIISREDGSSISRKDGEWPVGNDQLESLLQQIESNPNSRRLIVSGWHPVEQFRVALPPCHTLWQCKVHTSGELSLHLYARSIDIFLGLPFNIASYGLLLTLIGRAVDRPIRDLIISFGDLHLYNNHVEQAQLQLSRGPLELPRLFIRPSRGKTALEHLLNFNWNSIVMSGYQYLAKIEAEVAV